MGSVRPLEYDEKGEDRLEKITHICTQVAQPRLEIHIGGILPKLRFATVKGFKSALPVHEGTLKLE